MNSKNIEPLSKMWTSNSIKLRRLVIQSNAGEVIDKGYWYSGNEILYTCAKNSLESDYPDFPDWKRTTGYDLLLTRNGTPYIHLPEKKAIYSNVVQRIQLVNTVSREYIKYALEVSVNHLVGYGVSIDSLNYDLWKDMTFLLPSLSIQKAIVAYLDKETSRIDALIAKKERQIELLQEKRQAIITRAITKGLDPNAKMKDSGIEWIGEIPEGWKVVKVKSVVKHLESGVSVNATDEPADNDDIGVLKTSCVYTGIFNEKENKKVWEEERQRVKCPVRKGSVIISRMNTPSLVGSSGYVNDDYPNLFLPDRLWQTVYYNRYTTIGKYLWYFIGCDLVKQSFSVYATGTSDSMKNLSQEDFMNTPFLLAPEIDRNSIIKYLEIALQSIDKLAGKIVESISLLREYRSSLITAAVSGQIDVSQEVKP